MASHFSFSNLLTGVHIPVDCTGDSVGAFVVGNPVVATVVGSSDGDSVGFGVGTSVGALLGLGVGASVGALVG